MGCLLQLLEAQFAKFFNFITSSSEIFFKENERLERRAITNFSNCSKETFIVGFSPRKGMKLSST